jgi:hypothetical protein
LNFVIHIGAFLLGFIFASSFSMCPKNHITEAVDLFLAAVSEISTQNYIP